MTMGPGGGGGGTRDPVKIVANIFISFIGLALIHCVTQYNKVIHCIMYIVLLGIT